MSTPLVVPAGGLTPASSTEQVQLITVDGAIYLGFADQDDASVTIREAIALGSVGAITKSHLVAYLSAKIMNSLQKPIQIRGNGVSFSVSDLSDDLAIEYKALLLKVEQAQDLALRRIVSTEFKVLASGG